MTSSIGTKSRTRSSRRLSTRAATRSGSALDGPPSCATVSRSTGPLAMALFRDRHGTPGAGDLARSAPTRLAGRTGRWRRRRRYASRGVRRIPREALADGVDHLVVTRRSRSLAIRSRAEVTSAAGNRAGGYCAWFGPGRAAIFPWRATSRSGVWNEQAARASATSSAAVGTIRTTSFSSTAFSVALRPLRHRRFRCVAYGDGPAPPASLPPPIALPSR